MESNRAATRAAPTDPKRWFSTRRQTIAVCYSPNTITASARQTRSPRWLMPLTRHSTRPRSIFLPLAGDFTAKGYRVAGAEGSDGAHEQTAAVVEGAEGEGQFQHLVHVGHGGRAGVHRAAKDVLAGKLLVVVDVALAGLSGQAEVAFAVDDFLALGDGEFGQGVSNLCRIKGQKLGRGRLSTVSA